MAIGIQYVFRLHQDAGVITFDSLTRKPFTHDASFVATSSAVGFEDFPGSAVDAFTVQFSYPEGSEPAGTTSLHDLIDAAVQAVEDLVAAGGVGGGIISPTPSY